MSERFYVPWPLSPGPVELAGPEAHHLTTVSRLRPGDPLTLFNGDGCEYPARVVQAGRRAVTVEVLAVARPARELPVAVEVAAPVPKGDRSQFLVEKLTELGVTTFRPLACQRSIVHPREGRRDKFERYVIEASKQCGRNVLMAVGDLVEWGDYCRSGNAGLLAHPGGSAAVRRPVDAATPIRLAVGPEGGFTDEEVALALAHGWQPVGLGPRILRIETAALALAVLMIGGLSSPSGGIASP